MITSRTRTHKNYRSRCKPTLYVPEISGLQKSVEVGLEKSFFSQ